MKTLNQTESPIFMILFVLCFQMLSFDFYFTQIEITGTRNHVMIILQMRTGRKVLPLHSRIPNTEQDFQIKKKKKKKRNKEGSSFRIPKKQK